MAFSCSPAGLSEDVFDHAAVDSGQAPLEAVVVETEPLVIQTQEV